MKITEHFDSEEFRVSAQFPELARDIILLENDLLKIFYICSGILESARGPYNEPFPVLSGKRTSVLNEAVDGVEHSDHLLDRSCAVDFTMRRRQKLPKVYGWIYTHCYYSVGEMILYFDKKWKPRFIHVSLPTPKHHLEFYFDYNKGEDFDIIDKHLGDGSIIIYTAPIKALSNQKYKDFCKDYGRDNIGLITGEIVINPTAPVLVMTTEIYPNMTISNDPSIDLVKYVVFDEIHYINDIERGYVWEESLIFSTIASGYP